MARMLIFDSVMSWSLCSYYFCPVEKPADLNRELLKDTFIVCIEKLQLFRFHFTHKDQAEICFNFNGFNLMYNEKKIRICTKIFFDIGFVSDKGLVIFWKPLNFWLLKSAAINTKPFWSAIYPQKLRSHPKVDLPQGLQKILLEKLRWIFQQLQIFQSLILAEVVHLCFSQSALHFFALNFCMFPVLMAWSCQLWFFATDLHCSAYWMSVRSEYMEQAALFHVTV